MPFSRAQQGLLTKASEGCAGWGRVPEDTAPLELAAGLSPRSPLVRGGSKPIVMGAGAVGPAAVREARSFQESLF